MKTIKSLLIVATLIGATAVSTLSAQQAAQPAPKHEFKVQLGDSVMIKRECQKYLTGERPSSWVWDKVHTVRQLGTKRFPDGVLLMNIYSWMCEDCLIPVNGHAEEAAQQAAEEQAEDREAFEAAQREKQQRERDAIAAGEEAVKAAEEAAAEEQKQKEEEKQQEPVDTTNADRQFKSQYDRFTIGLRGGASALMHHANKGNWTCGGDVVLDLQYAHYWTNDLRPADLGIIVGLGLGYQASGLKTNDSTAFTKANVDYTVVAKDIKETDHQFQLEVPVMFSMIHDNGLFLNVGPKFMIPLYTPYQQTVNQQETHITAYFPETGITIQDNPVTGQYTGQQPEEKNGIQFNINVMLTAEIGYEWILKSGNSLGLGAYANYSVFNTYKNTTNSEGLFNLTAPTDDDKAKLDVLSATHAYADKLGYFDAGIKLAYHFNFPKKKYKEFKANKL
ncbi:MAG: hypothetical protein IK073_00715 [Paludibacteraceae bacterium]|nr:hypothetical protein [Paludibacteraceae bacterium]